MRFGLVASLTAYAKVGGASKSCRVDGYTFISKSLRKVLDYFSDS